MEESVPFIFAGFDHDAALEFANGNTDVEIDNLLDTFDDQQFLSFYTYLQSMEDTKRSEIRAVRMSKLSKLNKILFLLSPDSLGNDEVDTKSERECTYKFRTIQNKMQRRLNAILAPVQSRTAMTLLIASKR